MVKRKRFLPLLCLSIFIDLILLFSGFIDVDLLEPDPRMCIIMSKVIQSHLAKKKYVEQPSNFGVAKIDYLRYERLLQANIQQIFHQWDLFYTVHLTHPN